MKPDVDSTLNIAVQMDRMIESGIYDDITFSLLLW